MIAETACIGPIPGRSRSVVLTAMFQARSAFKTMRFHEFHMLWSNSGTRRARDANGHEQVYISEPGSKERVVPLDNSTTACRNVSEKLNRLAGSLVTTCLSDREPSWSSARFWGPTTRSAWNCSFPSPLVSVRRMPPWCLRIHVRMCMRAWTCISYTHTHTYIMLSPACTTHICCSFVRYISARL